MPSMSGWVLRRLGGARACACPFLCPRCRAGCCDENEEIELTFKKIGFLCPRCRAGLCGLIRGAGSRARVFLCPRCRAGVATRGPPVLPVRVTGGSDVFLCPRCRAGCCDDRTDQLAQELLRFLCPRCRAGCCDRPWLLSLAAKAARFYALDVELGVRGAPTSAVCALRRECCTGSQIC